MNVFLACVVVALLPVAAWAWWRAFQPKGKRETMTRMRAKLRLNQVVRNEHSETLHFNAVAAKAYPADGLDGDNTYARFSPSAELKLTVANPALLGRFNPGETYYVDFTSVPEPVYTDQQGRQV